MAEKGVGTMDVFGIDDRHHERRYPETKGFILHNFIGRGLLGPHKSAGKRERIHERRQE